MLVCESARVRRVFKRSQLWMPLAAVLLDGQMCVVFGVTTSPSILSRLILVLPPPPSRCVRRAALRQTLAHPVDQEKTLSSHHNN